MNKVGLSMQSDETGCGYTKDKEREGKKSDNVWWWLVDGGFETCPAFTHSVC